MNMQWLKFIILIFVAIISSCISLIIYKKTKYKEKYSFYFSILCMFSSLWTIFIATSLVIDNTKVFIWIVKLSFTFASLIFLSFYFFSIEFPYKAIKIPIVLNYIILCLTIFILFIIFNGLVIGHYNDSQGLRWINNKYYHAIFAIYFSTLLFISYLLLIIKLINAHGINKQRLRIIIIGTLIAFSAGTIFSWYLPQIDIYQFRWIGPLFIVSMQTSITYLLFKKD